MATPTEDWCDAELRLYRIDESFACGQLSLDNARAIEGTFRELYGLAAAMGRPQQFDDLAREFSADPCPLPRLPRPDACKLLGEILRLASDPAAINEIARLVSGTRDDDDLAGSLNHAIGVAIEEIRFGQPGERRQFWSGKDSVSAKERERLVAEQRIVELLKSGSPDEIRAWCDESLTTLATFSPASIDAVCHRIGEHACQLAGKHCPASLLRQMKVPTVWQGGFQCHDATSSVKLLREWYEERKSHAQPADPSDGRGKRRGRKKASEETMRREEDIVFRWERARDAQVCMYDFAKDEQVSVRELKRLIARVRMRNVRENK